jgi:diacylglycerol kinase (ATP)
VGGWGWQFIATLNQSTAGERRVVSGGLGVAIHCHPESGLCGRPVPGMLHGREHGDNPRTGTILQTPTHGQPETMNRKFIINPHSGSAVTAGGIARLREFFTTRTGSFDHSVAGSRDAAVSLTREALREGADQVVAVGGDGTVNAVANGFFDGGRPVRPESTLAVANLGTGSDFFRTLIQGTSVRDWRQLVLDQARTVDVGRVRYSDPHRCDEYFVNMASAGMTAEVAGRKRRCPTWLPGVLRYLLPTAACLFSCQAGRAEVEVDGECRDVELLAISVCKGTYAGCGMRFGGGVTPSDGLFDVTLFGAMRPAEMLLKLRKLYTGSFDGEPTIQKLRARRVSIRASSPMPVEFDGEPAGTTDVEFCIQPDRLRVCFPRGSVTSPGQ